MATINLKILTENLDSYVNEKEIVSAYQESLEEF